MATVKECLFVAAATRDVSAVDQAIQTYRSNNNNRFYTDEVKEADSRTILHYACLYNTEEVALHVLSIDNFGKCADRYGAYPYMYAARRGYHQLLKMYASKYGSLRLRDEKGLNALQYCFGEGADSKPSIAGIKIADSKMDQSDLIKCAAILLENDVDAEGLKETSLEYALQNYDKDLVKWFLGNGNIDAILEHKFRFPDSLPLSLGELINARKPNMEVSNGLLCNICNLETEVNFEKGSAAHTEATVEYRLGCAESVFKYLPMGEFVFEPKESPLRVAIDTEFLDMVRWLNDKKVRVIYDKGQALHESVIHLFMRTLFAQKNTNMLKEKVASLGKMVEECKLDVNVTDDRGMSPLHQLCCDTYETEPRTWRSLRVALVEKLISLNADFDNEDPKGRTPLILAVIAGNMDVCMQLLTSGADPGQVNKWGQTAFYFTKDKEMLALLNEYQTSPSMETEDSKKDNVKETLELLNEEKKRAKGKRNTEATMKGLQNRIEYVEASVDHLSNSNTELTQALRDLTTEVQELKQHIQKKD